MKTLILTRHAKSDWGNLLQKDFDRELNPRGLRDAPMMGARLAKSGIKLDLVISSTAMRAKQTANLIAETSGYNPQHIQWEEMLYHAPPRVIDEVIYAIPDEINTVMIVCHNPGITDFVNNVIGRVCDDMPTCAMCAFHIETDRWTDYKVANTKLFFFDKPKSP